MVGACCLMCAGFGLMFLGIIGAIIGVVIGVIIGVILNSVMSNTYQSVMVCQDCGYVSQPNQRPLIQPQKEMPTSPLFCSLDESNLMIVRTSNSIGSACKMEIKIDGYKPFLLGIGEVKYIKVPIGEHKVAYCQVNGMGKKNRQGVVDVIVEENRRLVQFDFSQQGVNVLIQ